MRSRRRAPRARVVQMVLAAVVLAGGCGDGQADDDAGESGGDGGGDQPGEMIVFSTEGNNLNAYRPEPPFEKQTVIRNAADDPQHGLDINGQICFFPGTRRFIAGEDTGQPERTPGWGIFELGGTRVGDLSAREVGRLVPTYQDDPDNYGCGILSDGRVVTTDIGNKVDGPPSGQLVVWFPPFDTEQVRYCKVDIALPTPGGIHVDRDDRVYVATARAPDNGIVRYDGPFPTSNDAAGGCGGVDPGGAPLVSSAVPRAVFIPADEHSSTPNALAVAQDGSFYVASAFSGTIARYDADGRYIGTLVQPMPQSTFGATPYASGSPFGLAVSDNGYVYFADLGLGMTETGVGPVADAGTVRRLAPVEGPNQGDGDGPAVVELMDEGLQFPDGIGLFVA